MSARLVKRALQRLAAPGCVLAEERSGGFGVFPQGDRRRRPMARLTAAEMRELNASGALERSGDVFVLSVAGQARALRDAALPEENFAAQHRPVIDRVVIDADGATRGVRGHEAHPALRKLAALKDADGAPFLSAAELNAATQLRLDWEAGERGLVGGSDWRAPPNGSAPRSRNGRELALAIHCDRRRRVSDSLARLALPLRRVVESVCLREEGLEALERAETWPARSGKIALKLALAQLAAG
jgi:hypothetical protein